MTGGAIGSLIAQFVHLTSAERKTLLVAGAAAGMSATFGTPIAAALLAVELLLFEWKPRSAVPVIVASAVAALLRPPLLGPGPLFPVPAHPSMLSLHAALGCLASGVLAGGLSWLLTRSVYAAEDAFQRLPIHWMWWPAIGGIAIGLGGLVFPQALGVGYDTIGALLKGDVPRSVVLGVLLVKSTIWAVALGSGTSGGVLAPLLMMGGALGGVEAGFFPFEGVGYWPLVSMAAILGGTMRVPFTAVVFALELTQDVHMLLPLLIAVAAAYALTVLTLPRSILTEKISRRGYHLTREYAIDPLEILMAREVMRPAVVTLHAEPDGTTFDPAPARTSRREQRLYPVIGPHNRLLGVITRGRLHALDAQYPNAARLPLAEALSNRTVVSHAWEPLRLVVRRMAETGLTRFPVVDDDGRFLGMIALKDLLVARVRLLEAESRRDRLLPVGPLWPAALDRLRRGFSRPLAGAARSTTSS
jgi:CBS domain-containing protein